MRENTFGREGELVGVRESGETRNLDDKAFSEYIP
jgi:hypothetical protein